MEKIRRFAQAVILFGVFLGAGYLGISPGAAQDTTRAVSNPPPHTQYTWWLMTWSTQEVLCSIPVTHEGVPNLSEVATKCGQGRGAAVTMLKEGERKEDILAGLHEAIATRVTALVKKVGIADKFVITGDIGRNVWLGNRIEQRVDGLKVTLPEEPMIVGAVGAALFALDRARKKREEMTS